MCASSLLVMKAINKVSGREQGERVFVQAEL
jgi:hypothetical protein